MKILTRTLALIAVLTLFCSLADAKIIRGTTTMGGFNGVDAVGNFTASPDRMPFNRMIKFTRSGIIINRVKQRKTVNLSGRRQVFKNVPGVFLFDPENLNLVGPTARDRRVYPKGKARNNNLVTMRFIGVFNPKKVPAP